jgi:hypothetical protein
MTDANTLERWRPQPLVFVYCFLAIALFEIACFWGFALLIARWCQPENVMKTALAAVVLFSPDACCRYGDALRLRCLLSAGCY